MKGFSFRTYLHVGMFCIGFCVVSTVLHTDFLRSEACLFRFAQGQISCGMRNLLSGTPRFTLSHNPLCCATPPLFQLFFTNIC